MQSIRKSIETILSDRCRDLDFGTIYFVPGRQTSALNEYVQTNADRIATQINQEYLNWITCKIVCVEDSNLFAQRPTPALYGLMLPSIDTPADAQNLFVALLNINTPELIDTAMSEYFFTLQEMLDEVLDTGNYQESHLRQTILTPYDESVCPSLSRSSDDGIRFSISPSKPLPFTEPSRLEITPYNHPLLLPDYNLEFCFGAQIKALYILFLRHPEGIRIKEIADYKQEFMSLYLRCSNRTDTDKLRESVDKLLDVCNRNTLDAKKSQCNSTIRGVIPNGDLNCHYVIEVARGEKHKINLDRSLVSMPEELRI